MIDVFIERLRGIQSNVRTDTFYGDVANALERSKYRIEELEARIDELSEISDAFTMDGESAVARIAELEAENTVLRRKLELYAATYLSARVISGEKE